MNCDVCGGRVTKEMLELEKEFENDVCECRMVKRLIIQKNVIARWENFYNSSKYAKEKRDYRCRIADLEKQLHEKNELLKKAKVIC